MGRYAASAQAATGSGLCLLGAASDGNVHQEHVLVGAGFSSTPADAQFNFGLYDCTGITGGTAVTPSKIGPAATPATTVNKGTFGTPPTKVGVALLYLPCYQRSTARAQKAFGEGWRAAAVASQRGLAIWCDTSGGTVNAECTMEWYE